MAHCVNAHQMVQELEDKFLAYLALVEDTDYEATEYDVKGLMAIMLVTDRFIQRELRRLMKDEIKIVSPHDLHQEPENKQ